MNYPVYLLAASKPEDTVVTFIFIGIGIIFIGIGIYSLGKYLATKALGLDVLLPPEAICRGDMLKVTMKVNPTKRFTVSQIKLRVSCNRYYERRDHRGRKYTEADVMAASEVFLPEEEVFETGQPRSINADILVPRDGLPTKLQGELTIKWFLAVVFEIPSSFNAEKQMELMVVDASQRRPVMPKPEKQQVIPSLQPDEKGKYEFKQCTSCGHENSMTDRFCVQCGADME